MAIDTRMNGPQSIRTAQAVGFNPVQVRPAEMTRSQELANALGVASQSAEKYEQAMGFEEDEKTIEEVKATYAKMSDVDKAIVLGHDQFRDKSQFFRDSLNKLKGENRGRLVAAEAAKAMSSGQLQSQAAVQEFMTAKRKEYLGETQDTHFVSAFDDVWNKALTEYGMLGAAKDGENLRRENAMEIGKAVRAQILENGVTAGFKAFHENNKLGLFQKNNAPAFVMEALTGIAADDSVPAHKVLTFIREAKKAPNVGEDGVARGTIGEVGDNAIQFQKLQDSLMVRANVEATQTISFLQDRLNAYAATGDEYGTYELVNSLAKHEDPAVAQYFKSRFDDAGARARAAASARTAGQVAQMNDAAKQRGEMMAKEAAFSALTAPGGLGSMYARPHKVLVPQYDKDGNVAMTEMVFSGARMKEMATEKAVEESHRWRTENANTPKYKDNPDLLLIDSYKRDREQFARVGLKPPYHEDTIRTMVGSLMIPENAKEIPPDGARALRIYEQVAGDGNIARELFGQEADKMRAIHLISKKYGRGDVAAVQYANAYARKSDDERKLIDQEAQKAVKKFNPGKVVNDSLVKSEYMTLFRAFRSTFDDPQQAHDAAVAEIENSSETVGNMLLPKAAFADITTRHDDGIEETFNTYIKATYGGKVDANILETASLVPVSAPDGRIEYYKLKQNEGPGRFLWFDNPRSTHGDVKLPGSSTIITFTPEQVSAFHKARKDGLLRSGNNNKSTIPARPQLPPEIRRLEAGYRGM